MVDATTVAATDVEVIDHEAAATTKQGWRGSGRIGWLTVQEFAMGLQKNPTGNKLLSGCLRHTPQCLQKWWEMHGKRRIMSGFKLEIFLIKQIIILSCSFKPPPHMCNHGCDGIVPSCYCWLNLALPYRWSSKSCGQVWPQYSQSHTHEQQNKRNNHLCHHPAPHIRQAHTVALYLNESISASIWMLFTTATMIRGKEASQNNPHLFLLCCCM